MHDDFCRHFNCISIRVCDPDGFCLHEVSPCFSFFFTRVSRSLICSSFCCHFVPFATNFVFDCSDCIACDACVPLMASSPRAPFGRLGSCASTIVSIVFCASHVPQSHSLMMSCSQLHVMQFLASVSHDGIPPQPELHVVVSHHSCALDP